MDSPENSSPMNGEAAAMFRECEKKYNEATKGINLEYEQRTQIYNEYFQRFDEKTNSFSGKDIQQYLKYFNRGLVEVLDNMKC